MTSRTTTEQTETLQRRESRKVFHAVRQSAISLNYEEKDIEDAASILSEDPSVILDVDPIILRSKVYQKYHPERYQRMIQRFPSRTSTSSTQKTEKVSRHTRKKSLHDDPILPENMGLPFLGIPFQGESIPDRESETSSEPTPTHSLHSGERAHRGAGDMNGAEMTPIQSTDADPVPSEAVTHRETVETNGAKAEPVQNTSELLNAVQEENPRAEPINTAHSQKAAHEELGDSQRINPSSGSIPMHHAETENSEILGSFQDDEPRKTSESSLVNEVEPPSLDSPAQAINLHRTQSVTGETTNLEKSQGIDENAPEDFGEKTELSSERSWHASDISDLYSDSETRTSNQENKKHQGKEAVASSESQIGQDQSSIDSISIQSRPLPQGTDQSPKSSSCDQDDPWSAKGIPQSAEAPRLDYVPDRHPLGINFDFGSGPILDIIAPSMPDPKLSEATDSVIPVASYSDLSTNSNPTLSGSNNAVGRPSDSLTEQDSEATQEPSSSNDDNLKATQEPSNSNEHNSMVAQEPSNIVLDPTSEMQLGNLPPVTQNSHHQDIRTLPMLQLENSEPEEPPSMAQDTENHKRRISTSSVPNFSYHGRDSGTLLEPKVLPSRSLTLKLPAPSSVPPSPKRAPPPVPPRPSRITKKSLAESERSARLDVPLKPAAAPTRSKPSYRRPKPPPIPRSLPARRSTDDPLKKESEIDPQPVEPPSISPTSHPVQNKAGSAFDDILISKPSKLGPPASPPRLSTSSIQSDVIESVDGSADSTVSSNDRGTSQTKATSVSETTLLHSTSMNEEVNISTNKQSQPDPEQLKISHSLGILVEKKPEKSFKRLSKLPSITKFLPLSSRDKSTKVIKLAEAADKGDLSSFITALKALDRPSDAKMPVAFGSEKIARTPLMRTAAGGHVACMEELAPSDDDCSAVDRTGRTALHYALQARKDEAAQWLVYYQKGLKRTPSANNVDEVKRNPLSIADKDGIMPVHLAACLEEAKTLDVFINEGVDFFVRDSLGRLPLHFAVQKQSLNCVKYLGERMDNVNETDISGETPLMLAARVNGQNSVRFLLEHNADKNKRDINGDYAIHHAARAGHLTVLEMLFLSLDDLEVKNNRGERPLHLACANNHLRVVRAILGVPGCQVNPYTDPPHMKNNKRSKADISETSRNLASTPLHYACRCGLYDIVDLLIRNGAMVNANQEDGTSPLMLACNANSAGIAELLLKNGANPNSATSKESLTALHISVRRNDIDTTKRLIAYGADSRARLNNGEGDTPVGLALREGTGAQKNKQEALNYVMNYNRHTWRLQNPRATPSSTTASSPNTGPRLGPEGSAYAAPYVTSEQTYSYASLATESVRVRDSEFQEFFSPPAGAASAAPPSYAESQAQIQGSGERPTKQ